MPNLLYEDFLEDDSTYRDARRFWERLFLSALPRVYPGAYLSLDYINNPDADGNPIFSGLCRPLGMAFRVIQQPVGDPDDVDFDWWIDSTDFGGTAGEVRELVVSCCPSLENLPEVERVLREWFTTGEVTSEEDRPWGGRVVSFEPELCLS